MKRKLKSYNFLVTSTFFTQNELMSDELIKCHMYSKVFPFYDPFFDLLIFISISQGKQFYSKVSNKRRVSNKCVKLL